jgi:hypothetical protein
LARRFCSRSPSTRSRPRPGSCSSGRGMSVPHENLLSAHHWQRRLLDPLLCCPCRLNLVDWDWRTCDGTLKEGDASRCGSARSCDGEINRCWRVRSRTEIAYARKVY